MIKNRLLSNIGSLLCFTSVLFSPNVNANQLENIKINDELQIEKKVIGRVVDSKGMPIIGATIMIKGSTDGTISDVDGNFTLNVPENELLEVSYMGYIPQIIKVIDDNINVVLKEDTKLLDEVVVVGYGVQKKKLLTGATSHVGGKDVLKMNSTSVLGAMQGNAPGLNITTNSASPGSDYRVNIRGIGTTGTSTPLYIVDGVVVNSISNINTADIESVDILKDAASAAIYGSRAANGVVLITTRQGDKGKLSLSYDGYYAIQTPSRMPDLLNAQEYAMIMSEAALNSGMSDFDYESLVPNWNSIESGEWSGTDWFDEITRSSAPMQNHSLNLTGGTDNSVFSMGLSYYDQQGVYGKPANPLYRRYTFRINSDFVVAKGDGFDILKIGENLTYSNEISESNLAEGGNQSSIRNALMTNPFLPMYDDNGDYHYCLPWYEEQGNPYALIEYRQDGNQNNKQNIIGKVYVDIQPIKNFKLHSSFGITSTSTYSRSYMPVFNLSTNPTFFRTTDNIVQSHNNSFRWIFENTLSYDYSLRNHTINAIIGTSAERSGIGQSIKGTNQGSVFNGFKYAYLDNVPSISSSLTKLSGAPLVDERLLSYFGRVNYNYNETYMASLVFRADGSSNFAPSNRWGYFPSISAGWVISNESFMSNTKNWLDFLKLRLSWGQNGNSAISPFQYLSTISTNDPKAVYFIGTDKNQIVQGAYSDIIANPDVKWETSEQLNIGFDTYFMNNRLSFAFDWYNKKTKDWLVKVPILGSVGTGAPYMNGGDVMNTGVEIALGWNDSFSDFRYNISGNVSYNKNEVTKIANSEGIIHGSTDVISVGSSEFYRAEVGYPIGYFWALKTDGIFQNQSEIDNYVNSKGEKIMPNAKPGDIRFVNQDDNNTIDMNDRVMVGSPHPKYRIGTNLNFWYKGFDFSMNTDGAFGHHILKCYRNITQGPKSNYTTDILGRWTGEGTSNSIPRVTMNNHINDSYISDRYIEKGNYWRCSNLTFGYDFKNGFKNIPFEQLRLYFSVQNLFIVTSYSGIDPTVVTGSESWASGIDLGNYPSTRNFIFGASIKF